MGLLNSALEYRQNINRLYEHLDSLERTIILIPNAETRQNLDREAYVIRQCVNWLEESREELFEAIDKALEER